MPAQSGPSDFIAFTEPDYDDVLPITEDDDFIARALADAELPALLAALALVDDEPELLGDDLKPPLPPMDSVIAPQGG